MSTIEKTQGGGGNLTHAQVLLNPQNLMEKSSDQPEIEEDLTDHTTSLIVTHLQVKITSPQTSDEEGLTPLEKSQSAKPKKRTSIHRSHSEQDQRTSSISTTVQSSLIKQDESPEKKDNCLQRSWSARKLRKNSNEPVSSTVPQFLISTPTRSNNNSIETDQISSERTPRKIPSQILQETGSLSSSIDSSEDEDVVKAEAAIESGIKKNLVYFHSMVTKRFNYDVKRAEHELIQCLEKFPMHEELILKIVLELKDDCLYQDSTKWKGRHQERLQEVFILLIEKPQFISFIRSYFEKNPHDIDLFSHQTIRRYMKNGHRDIMSILFEYTLSDTQVAKRDSLFRGTSLSSSLCKMYGNYLLSKQLKFISEKVAEQLSTYSDLSLLCFDRKKVEEYLQRIKHFKPSEVLSEEREQLVASTMELHMGNFIGFTRQVLSLIYQTPIPREFTEVLTMRRNHVVDFVQAHPRDDNENAIVCSRPYVSELLFFRILSPRLLSINTSNEWKKEVLVKLTKVIQTLANETLFDTTRDEVYLKLNPLVKEFADTHRKFIDKHSGYGSN